MLFSTKETKADTKYQPCLLSNTELSHKSQQKAWEMKSSKIFNTLLQIITEITEKLCT